MSIVEAADEYVGGQVARRKLQPATAQTYRSHVARFAGYLRGLGHGDAVSDLRPEVVTDLLAADAAAGLGEGASYAAARVLLAVWAFAHRRGWTVVVPPVAKDVLPSPGVYRPTRAPTLGHVDAFLRTLNGLLAAARERPGKPPHAHVLTVALVCRYLGLRGAEVLSIRPGDVFPDPFGPSGLALHVRGTKSAAADRELALPLALLEEPGVRAAFASGDWPDRSTVADWFRTAWAVAPVPREVWDPPERKRARPRHALRAALLSWLDTAGRARPAVVDIIAGHAGEGTAAMRARHYGPDTWGELRAALERVPRVQWQRAAPPALPALSSADEERRNALVAAMREHDGNAVRVAAALGWPRATVLDRCKRWGVRRG